MARTTSSGKCRFCQAEFSKAGMSKHLASCAAFHAGSSASSSSSPVKLPARKKAQPARLFHLVVEGRRAPMYWMHIELPVNATLADLDDFLRYEWLECCGHLSAFTISGESYTNIIEREWGLEGKSMGGVKLGRILEVGQHFDYEYDFGSTTELRLKVVNEREGPAIKGEAVQKLAQNTAPQIRCEKCGKAASQVCGQCIYEETEAGWVCEECASDHECGEDMLLPVVNSPRVGICAYSG